MNIFRIIPIRIVIFALQLVLSLTPLTAQQTQADLSPEEIKWIHEHPDLVVANELDWPPFDFAMDGEPQGYSIDLMKLVRAKTGLGIRFVNGFTWNEILERFRNREIDILPCIFATQERFEFISFTETYAKNPPVLIVQSGRDDLATLADLNNKTVAVVEGYATAQALSARYPDIQARPVQNPLEGLQAVSRGTVDGFVESMSVVSFLLQKHFIPNIQVIGDVDLKKPEEMELRMGVAREQKILRDLLQKGLNAVSPEEIGNLRQKWLPINAQEKIQDSSLIEKAGKFLAIGLAIFLLLFFVFRLFRVLSKKDSAAFQFGSRHFRSMTLVTMSILIALVLVLGWLVLEQNKKQILVNVQEYLQSVLTTTNDRLGIWIEQRKLLLAQLGRDAELVQITERLLEVEPEHNILAVSPELALIRQFFERNQDRFEKTGFYIINPDLITIAAHLDYPLGSPSLTDEQLFRIVDVFQGEAIFMPPQLLPVSDDSGSGNKTIPTLIIVSPIQNAENRTIAALVHPIDPSLGFSQVFQFARVGKSGESYSFDREGRLLSESRFDDQLREIELIKPDQSGILNIEIRDPGGNMVEGYRSPVIRNQLPLTRMAASAVRGERGVDVDGYRDYRGVPVFGAWIWNDELGLGITSEIDADEALALYDSIKISGIGILSVTLFLTVVAILFTLVLGERATATLQKAKVELEVKVKDRTQEISNQKELLENTLESLTHPFYVIDANDYAIKLANSAARKAGLTEQATCHALTHYSSTPCDDSEHPCPLQLVKQTRAPVKVEHIHYDHDGKPIHAEVHGYPIFDDDGNITQMIEYSLDITERKEAEARIRASEERLRSFIDSAIDGIIVLDRQGMILEFSPAAETIFGYSQEETLGKNVTMLMPDSFRSRHSTAMSQYLEGAAPRILGTQVEVEGLRKDGGTFPLDLSVADASVGDERLFTGIIRDITDRKVAEKQLTIQATALESAANAIVITSRDGEIIWVNPSFSSLTGYTSEEAIGQNPRVMKSGKHDDGFYLDMWQTITAGAVWFGECINKRKDGILYTEEMTITPVFDDDDEISNFVAIKHDISQRKRLEQELADAYKRMQGELNIGREIQMSMLPLIFPAFPARDEFAVYAQLEPAREVGGDFYDFFFLDDEHFCFCVGDVSGKGVPSALFMAVTKTMIKTRAVDDLSPASIMTHVNNELSADNKASMFVTIFMGILNIKTGEMVYTNAGHNPPYIKRLTGAIERMDRRHGPIVGARAGLTYKEDKSLLSPGDLLLAYTDGVTEAMDTDRSLYSEERLADLLSKRQFGSVEEVVNSVMKSVHTFENGAEQTDDITILAFRLLGSGDLKTSRKLEITVPNQLPVIGEAQDAFREFAQGTDLPRKIVNKVFIILDELLNNVISYAYTDDDEHLIEVAIEQTGDRLEVAITDDGVPFNPLNQQAPDTTLPADKRQIGGLGIHLVRNFMDKIVYQRQKDKNILKMIKLIPCDGGDQQTGK